MSPDPAGLAEDAAAAIRGLNHALQPAAGGLRTPADAYTVLGSLGLLAGRLPHALGQLDAFLTRELQAGRISVADGEHADDPRAAITTSSVCLDHASDAARALLHALDQAHACLTWIAGTQPTD